MIKDSGNPGSFYFIKYDYEEKTKYMCSKCGVCSKVFLPMLK